MTQYYSDRKFSLVTAQLHTRVLITAFNFVILVALCVGLVNYWDKTGMSVAGVTAFYRGNESQVLAAGQAMTFEKTFRELLDATHPHLFGQGVLLFILSHIVALTGLSQRTKIVIYLVSFGAMLLDASVPWMIRYVSPDLAPVQILSVTLLTAAFIAQMVFPIREMWFMKGQVAAVRSEKEEPVVSRPPARSGRPERRPRRDSRDSHHRTGPAPRSEPRGERAERSERPKSSEAGGESSGNPERRGRRRRGRRPPGRSGEGSGGSAQGASQGQAPGTTTSSDPD